MRHCRTDLIKNVNGDIRHRVSAPTRTNIAPNLPVDDSYSLLLADAATGAAMSEMFHRDLDGSREIRPETWARRPLWQKIAESLAGLFDDNL